MQPNNLAAPQAPVPFDPNATQVKQRKLIRLIAILAVVGVISMILISLLGGPPKNSELSSVLANQQEMLRIIDERREELTTTEGANYVSVLRPILVSQSRDLVSAGVKVTVPINGSSIDSALDEAVRNSRLDEELVELLAATLAADKIVLDQVNAVTEESSKLKPLINQLISDYSALAVVE